MYEKFVHAPHVSVPELTETFAIKCPQGVAQDVWERFVYSICLEYFRLGYKDEFCDQSLVKMCTLLVMSLPSSTSPFKNNAEVGTPPSFKISTPESPSGSSVNAVMDLPLERSYSRWSISASVSSAEVAGAQETHKYRNDHYISDINTASTCVCRQPKKTGIEGTAEDAYKDDVRDEFCLALTPRYSIVRLGDLSYIRCGDNMCYNETKRSTASQISPGSSISG